MRNEAFEHIPNSVKVRCKTCGKRGYETGGLGWQATCLRGHAPCPMCGHINTLKIDGSPRTCVGSGARNRHLPKEP